MKKTYSKPDIVFEDFSLTTSIASGCEVRVDTQSSNQCGLDMGGGLTLFIEGVTGCNWKPTLQEDGSYDGMCYHVPIETNNLFNS